MLLPLLAALPAFARSQVLESPIQLRGIEPTVPEIVGRAVNLGPVDPNTPIHLCVSLHLRDRFGLKAYADAVSNPRSPLYRRFLGPDEIARLYAQPAHRVERVANYFRSFGFRVERIGRTLTSVILDGTVGQANAAFHTRLDRFQLPRPAEGENPDFRANASLLQVPPDIAQSILHVEGLQTFAKAKGLAAFTPSQARTLYKLKPLFEGGYFGKGRKVGVSNWDGYRLSNVPLLYTQYGLPAPAGGVGTNIQEVHVGAPSAGAGTANGEGDLDIQMVLAMAPHCELTVYDGNTAWNRIEVVTRQADDNAVDIVCESWGWWATNNAWFDANHNQQLILTAEGITYIAASGDTGTTIDNFPYPTLDGEVLMVGGTTAAIDADGNRTGEVAWPGGGGGWSTVNVDYNVRPTWQVGTGVPADIDRRLSPDVSLHSSGPFNSGAYSFYLNGVLENNFNGTSFACPIFGGGMAALTEKLIAMGGLPADSFGNRRMGRIQDLIYAQNGRTDVWFDVQSGANGNLPNGSTSVAGTGWDFATGWGAIDWNGFLNAVRPRQVTGRIKQGGLAVPGVKVKLMQGSTVISEGTTDANGDYSVGGPAGNYTVVPSHNDKYFFPSSKPVSLAASDIGGQNFTAANNGPVSIQFEYPVVYSDQSRKATLNLIVVTPVDREITMSDNTTKLTSPIKVTVPAGSRSANFFVYGVSTVADVLATITASHQGVVATGSITVRAKPVLTGIALPNSVKGGNGVSGSVSIDKPAVGAMYLVLGTSNSAVATTSPSATAMPNGATTKAFYAKTFPVAAATNVNVTATFYGSSATKVLQVLP